MIVVDTNVLGYLFLTSEHSPWAERVLAKDPEWATPLLWRSESFCESQRDSVP